MGSCHLLSLVLQGLDSAHKVLEVRQQGPDIVPVFTILAFPRYVEKVVKYTEVGNVIDFLKKKKKLSTESIHS